MEYVCVVYCIYPLTYACPGEEIMALISGRLRSTLKGVVLSVCAAETDIPPWYLEGNRF